MTESTSRPRPALQRVDISAVNIVVGDRLDADGKTRVARRHDRLDDLGALRVLVQTKTRGARSPSVRSFDGDETVSVWRKPKTQDAPSNQETTR